MEKVKEFRIKSYGWQELACLYKPDISPASASKRLRYWVNKKKSMKEELLAEGWTPDCRTLTPREVQIIVNGLGEP
ncbi:MAG: DUF4248 domain-containing protein [Bacteroides sp.]|nr:DUF4248 domain-containing protein [Bacteroides sp.]